MFKSYYVVWKHFLKRNNTADEKEFKSYYVVWKQRRQNIWTARCIWFKSYYVVWKLRHFTSFREEYGRFKSYYVVWKLQFADDIPIMHESLNRTMQYGNYINIKIIIIYKQV